MVEDCWLFKRFQGGGDERAIASDSWTEMNDSIYYRYTDNVYRYRYNFFSPPLFLE